MQSYSGFMFKRHLCPPLALCHLNQVPSCKNIGQEGLLALAGVWNIQATEIRNHLRLHHKSVFILPHSPAAQVISGSHVNSSIYLPWLQNGSFSFTQTTCTENFACIEQEDKIYDTIYGIFKYFGIHLNNDHTKRGKI